MKHLRMNGWCWLILVVISMMSLRSASAFTISGSASCPLGWVPLGAKVEIYDVDPLPGNTYHVDPVPLAYNYVDLSGNYTLTFTWSPGGPDFELAGPDLIFCVLQNIGGSVEMIYQEIPDDAHWNVNDGDIIPIAITSPLAVCSDPSNPPVPPNNDFLFTRIGNLEVADLSKGIVDLDSKGYYRARADGHTGNPAAAESGCDTDQPFGGTLTLFGWVGLGSDVTAYNVHYRYSTDNGSSWSGWNEVETPLSSKWYDTVNFKWISEALGPFSPGPAGSPTNLYKIPFRIYYDKTWSYIDRIALFNSNTIPDGLCEIKIEGYVWNYNMANAATPATSLDNNLPDSELTLRIDNSAPTVMIRGTKLNGVSKDVCAILSLGSGDNFSVEFIANDANGHLGNYDLEAMYGHNNYVSPKPTGALGNYNDNASTSPIWTGSINYSAVYNGTTYDATAMPTCAYQFRLNVCKRTTDGWGLIYDDVEDTWHATIQRP